MYMKSNRYMDHGLRMRTNRQFPFVVYQRSDSQRNSILGDEHRLLLVGEICHLFHCSCLEDHAMYDRGKIQLLPWLSQLDMQCLRHLIRLRD